MRLDSVLAPCKDGFVGNEFPKLFDSGSDTDIDMIGLEDYLDNV